MPLCTLYILMLDMLHKYVFIQILGFYSGAKENKNLLSNSMALE